ncbi:CLUMA_CG004051, isoform A [Clunio marinus]|uniref:CLUMA_CG004051, isoform A n=1 Tax=Clunio marinus TaxID=568069 RepID=A0A1J1HQL7_9DIPT|nr:CLUMA_CG004051, isoform A [Clunio marinus]
MKLVRSFIQSKSFSITYDMELRHQTAIHEEALHTEVKEIEFHRKAFSRILSSHVFAWLMIDETFATFIHNKTKPIKIDKRRIFVLQTHCGLKC